MHLSRRIAAATTAAALSLTAVTTASAATHAAPPAHAVKPTKGVKPAKPSKPSKPPKADRAVAKVVATARVLDRGLAAVATSRRLRGIEAASAETITANVAADRAAIKAVVAAVTADPSQAAAAYTALQTYRTSTYTVAIGQVRTAEVLLGEAATVADRVTTDAPDQQPALDQAIALLDGAHARALTVTATTPRADVAAISMDIEAAEVLLEGANAALAG